jgi:hypothetical protein
MTPPGSKPPATGGIREPVPPRLADLHRPYAPLARRQRVLVVLLALATSIAILALVLDAPGGVKRPRVPAATTDVPVCAPGQSETCVGSRMGVLAPSVVPPASAGR